MFFPFFLGEHKFRVELHGNLHPGDKSHFDGAGHKYRFDNYQIIKLTNYYLNTKLVESW